MPKDPELRKRGKELLKRGYALADTCQRTRHEKENSALALSSQNINFVVLIKSPEKKKIFKKLMKKHSKRRAIAIVHCVKLYFALHNRLRRIPGVYICSEGFQKGLLKHYLKLILKEEYYEKKIFIVSSLTPMFRKKNIADRLASKVIRRNRKPDLILKEKHFKELKLL